jgi:hypothetical protein
MISESLLFFFFPLLPSSVDVGVDDFGDDVDIDGCGCGDLDLGPSDFSDLLLVSDTGGGVE